MQDNIIYEFTSPALESNETMIVIDFKGFESISKPYEYIINLKSESPDIDMEAMLNNRCTFRMAIGEHETPIHGILSDFVQMHQVGQYTLYRAILVPRVWQLSLHRTNEIYLDMNIEDIIKVVLEEGGLTSLDYELNLSQTYKTWEYRCQFGESHLNLISRLMEHEGIYYYFKQDNECEKLIITDSRQQHIKMNKPDVTYTPATGLDLGESIDHIHTLLCRRKRMPKKIILKDYDYEKPTLDVKGEAVVDEKGTGEIFVYGENFHTPKEGKRLAQVRAEEILSCREIFHGDGLISRMCPGYTFDLKAHFRESFNQEYLVTSIEHSGVTPSFLTETDSDEFPAAYSNSFTTIPANTQFRPERITPKSRFYGTINAFVDSSGTEKYAEMDKMGRYKVTLPFDRVKRQEGKASHWFRMAQPYAGSSEGMHFPLRRGTEVLLTFINGDPDQPIIQGAVPNTNNPSVVNTDNHTSSVVQTSSGNLMEMEDQDGKSRIKFKTPHKGTYFHMGSANAPGEGFVKITTGIKRHEIGGGCQMTMASKDAFGDMEKNNKSAIKTGETDQLFDEQKIYKFAEKTGGKGESPLTEAKEIAGNHLVERRMGDKYTWTDGDEYTYGGGGEYNYGNSYAENHADPGGDDDMKKHKTWDKQKWDENKYTVKGGPNYSASRNYVEKTWGDTINYQDGNNYSWGNTMDFEFGNGYSETHIDENATVLKTDHPDDSLAGTLVQIDKEKAIVEKMFGDTYSYQKGNVREVMHGNTDSVTIGESREYVDGNATTEIHKNSKETVFGNSDTKTIGASSDMYLGATNEMFLGVQDSMSLAACTEFYLGATSEMKLAAVFELVVGAIMEISLSNLLEIKCGGHVAIETGLKCEIDATTEVTAVGGINIEGDASAKLKAAGMSLKTAALNLATGAFDIKA